MPARRALIFANGELDDLTWRLKAADQAGRFSRRGGRRRAPPGSAWGWRRTWWSATWIRYSAAEVDQLRGAGVEHPALPGRKR